MCQNSSSGLLRDIVYTSVLSLVTGVVAAMGFALLAMLLSGQASASDAGMEKTLHPMSIDEVQRGSLLLKLASGGLSVDAPLLYTDVSMQVSGLVNRVTVKQQFHNPGEGWVEGIYVFPLPENAAVDHMLLKIGERVIEGEIHEKEQAQKIYDEALKTGKKASLLRQERPNIFTMAVANIGPDERVEVMIEYQQDLHYQSGQFSLRFPMVVAPRYIPGIPVAEREVSGFQGSGWAVNSDQVKDASRITPPVVDPEMGSINPVSLEIRLDAGFPLARLESRYHGVDIVEGQSGLKTIRLRDQHVPADRDFELIWSPRVEQMPAGALFTEQWQGEDYALLMIMPPVGAPASRLATPREIIFVVDTSGSMHGTSISQAKAALKMALSRLRADEHFNVIQFNNSTDALFGRAKPASPQHIRQALNYVEGLQADGGTEMLSALQRSLDGKSHEGLLRQVVFLTDGSVGNETELFSAIEQRLGSSRLFTVGIGSAPNSFFMTRAANFGRGSFTYIGDLAEVQEKMNALFSKLESPVLTDISASWSQSDGVEIWPARIPDLYLGEPVVLAAKLTSGSSQVQIRGMVNGQPWQQQVTVAGGAQSKGVRAIWARRKIADLMDQKAQGRAEEEVRTEVLKTALAHQLVSQYTSLVAVDKTPSRPLEEGIDSKNVPTNLPSGWNAAKVFGAMPQTATPAPLHLLLGLLSLFASWILGLFKAGKRQPSNTAMAGR
jgi:Ca-activated chloride channel family protein